MALLHAVADLVAWLGWYVVPFILILSLIVFVHELGHYLVGRWNGVKIDAFSLGFGPELYRPGGRARHPLAGRRAAARGICQVPRRRQCRQHGGRRWERPIGRPLVDLGWAAVAQPRGDRGGGAGRQFHSGLRDLHRHVHGLWPGGAFGAHRPSSSSTVRRRQPGFRPATSSSRSMGMRSTALKSFRN